MRSSSGNVSDIAMHMKIRRCSNALLLSAFAVLVAMYFVVAAATRGRVVFVPERAIDRELPLRPAWTPVYLSMWIFSLLPVTVVRGAELRRRTILSYLTSVITAYIVFLLYPTVAPRPADVPGDGVITWSLRTLYAIDPPYNCFPSLHVAYAFLAALSTYRVRRGLGIAALMWAVVIAISTLFIKQHYVADIVAGALLAVVAHAICVHRPTANPSTIAPDKSQIPFPAHAANAEQPSNRSSQNALFMSTIHGTISPGRDTTK